jgi:hypothetical protein
VRSKHITVRPAHALPQERYVDLMIGAITVTAQARERRLPAISSQPCSIILFRSQEQYCIAARWSTAVLITAAYQSSPSRWPSTTLRSAHSLHDDRRFACHWRRLRNAAHAKETSAAAPSSDSSGSSSSMKLPSSSAACHNIHDDIKMHTAYAPHLHTDELRRDRLRCPAIA